MGFFSKNEQDEQGSKQSDSSKISYENKYHKEQERLTKLWDAYEEQVGIICKLEKTEKELREELEDRELSIAELRELLDSRGITIPKTRHLHLESRVAELEKEIHEEREKVVKIFEISQELQDELNLARDQNSSGEKYQKLYEKEKERLAKLQKVYDELVSRNSVMEKLETPLIKAVSALTDQLASQGTSAVTVLKGSGMTKKELDLVERELADVNRV